MGAVRSGLVVGALALAGCSAGDGTPTPAPRPAVSGTPEATPPAPTTPAAPQVPAPVVAPPPSTSGAPRRAYLTVPALGLRRVLVRPYVGTPDDRPGTAIQDAGDLAAPHGSDGLVGPGGVGNYLVTGHRTSSTRPFAELPALRPGARVVVETRGQRLVYEITRTRSTSFRRPASLRAQSAAVPGHPARTPTRAMITLSTCATPEDHAARNFWSDALDNPEHRIDKIGVLRSVRPL
ncbi:class E sortase [uncultured Nocardioides sp.]|uniref:class E sortase n=1 Tax=uncultured Nocardioides sp. TaxID=198441 RepID=UPI00261208D3|nr:class E sortase [uncultured Nocardioides sp.]